SSAPNIRSGSFLVKKLIVLIAVLFLAVLTVAQTSTSPKKPLTIEAIFAEGSITGREPETLAWTPDGTRLSFLQRDDSGEHAELWSVDAATGEKKLLLNEAKLSGLVSSPSKIKSDLEKERLVRYRVASYHWAPDSKHLLFDSLGQLWYYTLDSAAVQLTSSPDPSTDPKFSP